MKVKFILFITSLFVLSACTNSAASSESYKVGLPEEFSPAMLEFLATYSMPMYSTIHKQDEDGFTYSHFNVENNPERIDYFITSKKEVANHFASLIQSDNQETRFNELTKDFESVMEPIEEYPEIELGEDNLLTLRSGDKETSIELAEKFNWNPEDELVVSIPRLSDKSIFLLLKNTDASGENRNGYILLSKDLTSSFVVGNRDSFLKNLNNGELNEFKDLLLLNEQYALIPGDTHILDYENKTTHDLDATKNKISRDGKYVWLGGNKESLKKGTHQLQRTEDYIAGSEDYYAEIQLDYDDITDELQIESASVDASRIVYFNEGLVILYLRFNSAITGTAGTTNVIFELSEDQENLTFYLADLGLQ
uniref:hypothetical protein n=1 Tax=uncultured Allobacillus sp. TaxID=1638025 RepID=UPI0025930A68|nr:hypothetical protein [uncultured Allobacillus sp.]